MGKEIRGYNSYNINIHGIFGFKSVVLSISLGIKMALRAHRETSWIFIGYKSYFKTLSNLVWFSMLSKKGFFFLTKVSLTH